MMEVLLVSLISSLPELMDFSRFLGLYHVGGKQRVPGLLGPIHSIGRGSARPGGGVLRWI